MKIFIFLLLIPLSLLGQKPNYEKSPFYDLHKREYVNLWDDFAIDFWIDYNNINKLVVRLGDLDTLEPYEKDGYIYTQPGRTMDFVDMSDNYYSFEVFVDGLAGGRKWYNADDTREDTYKMTFKFFMEPGYSFDIDATKEIATFVQRKIKRFEFAIEYKFDEHGYIYDVLEGPDILYVFEDGKVAKSDAVNK
jgi:hypothetical protein